MKYALISYQIGIYFLCGEPLKKWDADIKDIDVWVQKMRTVHGLEQEDGSFNYSHGAGTSSPSH